MIKMMYRKRVLSKISTVCMLELKSKMDQYEGDGIPFNNEVGK